MDLNRKMPMKSTVYVHLLSIYRARFMQFESTISQANSLHFPSFMIVEWDIAATTEVEETLAVRRGESCLLF